MAQSQEVNLIAKALNEARKKMTFAVKESENPFFKSSYANLSSVIEATVSHLSENGLVVTQLVNGACLDTLLLHESGQWISGSMNIVVSRQNDPQALGSAITYARRYSLAALCGITQDDDDGNGGAGRQEPTFDRDSVLKSLALVAGHASYLTHIGYIKNGQTAHNLTDLQLKEISNRMKEFTTKCAAFHAQGAKK